MQTYVYYEECFNYVPNVICETISMDPKLNYVYNMSFILSSTLLEEVELWEQGR